MDINLQLYGNGGYSGEFRGRVYDEDDNLLDDAHEYFWKLENESEEYEDYMEKITDLMYEHLNNNWYKQPKKSKFFFLAGFGGKYFDGLIEFYLEEKVSLPPSMSFSLYGKNYTLKFH